MVQIARSFSDVTIVGGNIIYIRLQCQHLHYKNPLLVHHEDSLKSALGYNFFGPIDLACPSKCINLSFKTILLAG